MSAAQSIEPGTAPRINFRNILLATDFSPASETALVYATAIARRYDAKMYVAHVIKPDAYQLVPAEAMSATQQQTWRYAEQQMTDLLISGRLRGIQHQVLLKQGEVWDVLEQVVQAHDVDLVVLERADAPDCASSSSAPLRKRSFACRRYRCSPLDPRW